MTNHTANTPVNTYRLPGLLLAFGTLTFGGAAEAGVRFLTGLWESGRGEGRTSPTDRLVWLAENRHRARTAATLSAIGWYFGSVLLLAAVLIVMSVVATSDEVPLVFEAFGFVPPLASLAAHRLTLRRRPRDLREAEAQGAA